MDFIKTFFVISAFVTAAFANSLQRENQFGLFNQNPNLIEIGEVNGKTFFTLQNSMTWSDANRFCDNQGLHWGKIDNDSEQELIYNYVAESRWSLHLSASDAEEEGMWTWAEDGIPLTYAAWGLNQPSNNTFENYLLITSISEAVGLWYDTFDGASAHPLCFSLATE